MKTIIILFIFILPFSLSAQTYIGPSFGYHLTQIEESDLRWETESDGFDNKQLALGVFIEQYIGDRFSIGLNSQWSVYDPGIRGGGQNPLFQIKFDYIRNVLYLGYDISTIFTLTAGIEYNYTLDMFLVRANDISHQKVESQKQASVMLGLSYRWKNFETSINYHHGFAEFGINDFQALSSIELGFRYRLKIFDKGSGGKKVKCPKL